MASLWENFKVDGEDMQGYVSVSDRKGPFPVVVVIWCIR
jgi:dienelactone hydrolase